MNSFPTYFAIISLTLTGLLVWMNHRLNQNVLMVPKNEKFQRHVAFDLAIVIMISGFLGGRLLHVFYEEWFYYLTYPAEIFKFWKGGFVYFGGFLGALLASSIYLKFKKLSFFPWADFFTPYFSLSYAFGRLACYLEGCCYGRTWIPLQLIMVVCELVLFGAVIFFEKRKIFRKPGSLFLTWIGLHAATRFLIEFYRTDQRGGTLFGVFSVSQLISLILFLGVSFIFFKKK